MLHIFITLNPKQSRIYFNHAVCEELCLSYLWSEDVCYTTILQDLNLTFQNMMSKLLLLIYVLVE